MSREDEAFFAGLGLWAMAVLLAVGMTNALTEQSIQQEAVDAGHAEYDSKTRQFKWIQHAEKENQ